MFEIYQKIVDILDYTSEFDGTEEIWQSLEIDELSAFIAVTDPEKDFSGFMRECTTIDRLIEYLGYEI